MTNLIDELLEEQQCLTAVERFAQRHERNAIPAHAQFYRDLIPLDRPQPGEQYAFAVDLDACTGCKACVTACHSLNGLDEEETWRGVGVIFGGTVLEPVQQTVTTACHHCVDPACMNGCPVLAYEKDPVTGIVRHLDDQCIGCQYCVLKCPYDVPKYSKKRGIVRKCDMCSNRLGIGEAPACVQACPSEAIRIEVVSKSAVSARSIAEGARHEFLPEAPDPRYTKPSTHYRSRRALPRNMMAGDAHRLVPEHGHPALYVMLALTQLSVGMLCFQPFAPFAGKLPATLALAAGALGILIGTAHLGRPLYAWRAVLGLRRSWLSREIVGFGAFANLAAALVALRWLPVLLPRLQQFAPALFTKIEGLVPPALAPVLPLAFAPQLQAAVAAAAALAGIAAVFCSVKIYEDTRRDFWRMSVTSGKFFGTTALLGVAATAALSGDGALWFALIFVATVKLAGEAALFLPLRHAEWTIRKQSALLMAKPLRSATTARFVCGATGGILLPPLVLATGSLWLAAVAFVLCLAGEFLERYLFFTAVVPPRMPGGIVS